jgi:lipopolysaccharide transport protein LptA
VQCVLVEEDKKAKKSRLVRVTADSLDYTDDNRRAYYRGNVVLEREQMTVRSAELEAFLRPGGQGESRLERAVAGGQVRIVESGGSRRATAEQAEYFAAEEKVVLRGGTPMIEQAGRGFTRGAELTYFLNDDRLLVSGRPGAPSESRQKLKRN